MKPVIIGSGLAGISTALALAPQPVVLISAGKFGNDGASVWAQGGIAAAIGEDDNPALHAADTMRVSGGLSNGDTARQITEDALRAVEGLARFGAPFDRDEKGVFCLGLEGGHSRRRIVHAGFASGAAIMDALQKAARAAEYIEILEDTMAVRLATQNGAICGVHVMRGNESHFIATDRVVLATGGAGALWQDTTNPLSARGQGLAFAARAGATLCDLEFMQFHPTAIDIGRDPLPLASEALRGEGATLVDDKGERFTDELQPRDVVTYAIWRRMQEGSRIFLDVRGVFGEKFAARFPVVYALCMQEGIDPARTPIPVKPAAHYHMGGIETDLCGRTNVKGLWACGEVASTGLHGANRLASNSLLEATVMGRRVAEDIAGSESGKLQVVKAETIMPPNAMPHEGIRMVMMQNVGVVRNRLGLQRACAALRPYAAVSDAALVGLIIAEAALRREESRGAQMREDFPAMSLEWKKRQVLTLADILPKTYPLAAGI